MLTDLCSRGRRPDRPDPPATKPQRPRREGSSSSAEVGTGQSAGQPGRVVGWSKIGKFPKYKPERDTSTHADLRSRTRAEISINKPSTSSRSSHRRRQPRQCAP
jgi:hypothetical protein